MPGRGEYPGPWYGDFARRLRFERAALAQVPTLQSGASRQPGRRGWRYALIMPVEHYEPRAVEILFGCRDPYVPRVYVDGPPSPHRYGDRALCMWYPRDGRDRRWYFDDGLLSLLSHVAVHLFREAWWLEYGEWLGDEVPHGALAAAPRAVR